MSGPSVHTTIELGFSALVGDNSSCMSIEEADHVARDHAPRTGFDPAPTIASLDVPGLWIYGALDSSIPVPSSIRVLESLRERHDFEIVLVPNASHELYRVRRDTEDERLLSTGMSPVALEALRSWLTRHSYTRP
jgi:pimeloyl-ACP methyl ester carboxylesterase